MVGMRPEMRSHRRLSGLAERQHGVVSAKQMRQIGYSNGQIKRAVAAGRLHRIHRGVYAVGHPRLTKHGRCIAAVAACGPSALLSHVSAAWVWGLAPTCPALPHVSVPIRGHRRTGIQVHRAPALDAADRAEREGIPLTAVPRTLLDLAATASRRLDRAIERSERLELFDLRAVDSLLTRTVGHAGSGPLRKALDVYREPAFTRSDLERRFLALVRKSGLPKPAANTFVAGFELDLYWAHERFAVELDSYEYHGGHTSFEQDRMRQEDLKLAGIEMTRITAGRIEREPIAVTQRLHRLLTQRRKELSRTH